MNKLTLWLNSNSNFEYESVTILLDNCPFHKTNRVKDYLMNIWFNIFFLPAYSPQLALVEIVFNVIKKKVIALQKDRVVNWGKSDSSTLVLQVMEGCQAEGGLKVLCKTIQQSQAAVSIFWILRELTNILYSFIIVSKNFDKKNITKNFY